MWLLIILFGAAVAVFAILGLLAAEAILAVDRALGGK